uniref:NADH-ubiquinone oxidoreductase chain 5 n=1 Tax=Quedenfeldtia trachyblepharus TaxID=460631 RepID=A0A343J8J2_9SAUR|nr:NADH dehydrogenase subunit 5 [Quedenfeldtia trachyblepharus]
MITATFHATLLLTLLILIHPLLMITSPTHQHPKHIAKTVKLACLTSTTPMMIFLNYGLQSTTTSITWLPTHFNITLSLLLDTYSIIFLPTALFITWAILEFTNWYMAADPQLNKFTKYLMTFMLAMTIMTTANNMLQLFIGWEGVGIMSFLLINWWHSRTNANTAALQAIIYNRTGDIGLILSMAWLATHLNTWEMQQIFSHDIPTLPILGFIMAATGKSAQFGLHPWLPAAMEGPTPVSALLHSSTMVVAGVFMLIRLHPLMQHNQTALTLCLCLGAMTTTFAALCALTQNDIKKIIAFSTSSQLGLMMLTIGLNQPTLAFLHIITHAFFKALLFLCAGSIIHNFSDEQDLRKMGGTQKTLPITTTCMTIGNLALAGTPFLAGFYTKDTIIEALNTSYLNAWALTTTLTATGLTAAYSLRLTFFTQTGPPRHPTPLLPKETNPNQTQPLMRLAYGSIFMGLVITSAPPQITSQPMTMPLTTKLAALLVSTLALLYTLDLMHHSTKLHSPTQTNISTTLSQLGFFNTLSHRTIPQQNLTTGQHTALQLNDLLWYEHLGPKTTAIAHTKMINKLSKMHTGLVKTHLSALTILTIISLTLTYS